MSGTKIPTLKPRLAQITTQRVPALTSATERIRGPEWMKTRLRIQVQQRSLCVDCGRLWLSDQDHVDHEVPLAEGGSNDDSNLRLRCRACHEAKTAEELKRQSRGEPYQPYQPAVKKGAAR